jgi:hypothetical protein
MLHGGSAWWTSDCSGCCFWSARVARVAAMTIRQSQQRVKLPDPVVRASRGHRRTAVTRTPAERVTVESATAGRMAARRARGVRLAEPAEARAPAESGPAEHRTEERAVVCARRRPRTPATSSAVLLRFLRRPRRAHPTQTSAVAKASCVPHLERDAFASTGSRHWVSAGRERPKTVATRPLAPATPTARAQCGAFGTSTASRCVRLLAATIPNAPSIAAGVAFQPGWRVTRCRSRTTTRGAVASTRATAVPPRAPIARRWEVRAARRRFPKDFTAARDSRARSGLYFLGSP